ncbi:c-type lectin domain-containing protein [Caerostris darwini]|uniref:C-type lectin domain-containing protein n=1 Tax=Caerostris darwini TaxID=1538125 RepID=A0AAV4PVH0_9ARAC|nr:c-type lectin domain-containing protein [Caerostris darwini]
MLFEGGLVLMSMLRTLVAMTTPMTTLPPTTPPPLNSFYVKYSASQHRQDKKLDVKPLFVVKDVSRIHCLGLCLQRQTGGKSKICRSFNWADRTCYMLNTFLCDGERELKDAPGFSYFDLVDDYSKEARHLNI